MPDRVELRLSDCFEKPEREEGEPCLECKALILNINAGREEGREEDREIGREEGNK